MKKHFIKYSLTALVIVSACDYPAPVYKDSGKVENLIDVSKETVSLNINDYHDISKLSSVISADQPASAELKCSVTTPVCKKAKILLEKNGIPFQLSAGNLNKITLTYDRIIARDCDQRYRDNMSGSRSLNHAAFGCSVTANALQMVSDKKQFTDPNLLDFPDAEKANQSYSGYMKPSATREVKDADWSTGSGSE